MKELVSPVLIGLGTAIFIIPMLYGLSFGHPIAESPAPLLIAILGAGIVAVGRAIRQTGIYR